MRRCSCRQGIRQLAQKLVAVHFPDVEDDRLAKQLACEERRARRNRYLTWGNDGDGAIYLRGKLPILDGERVINILTAYTFSAKGLNRRIDPEDEHPTAAQRYADALVVMVDELLRRQTTPATGGDRPHISIIMGFDDLVNGTGAATLTSTGTQVSPHNIRQLACGANLIPIVLAPREESSTSDAPNASSPPGNRKGPVVRDQGCGFPGCDAGPNRCDAHHLETTFRARTPKGFRQAQPTSCHGDSISSPHGMPGF